MEEGSRGRILLALKSEGELAIPELCERLGVARNAVRGHLAGLEAEGLVAYRWQKQPRGRPLKVYRLEERAEGLFPKAYAQLLEDVIRQIEITYGHAALAGLVRELGRGWAQRVRPKLRGADPPARLAELARELDLGGMLASLADEGDGCYALRVYNCVYRDTARQHQEICTLIPTLVTEATGGQAKVRRCICRGDAHCEYEVSLP